ncbi:MAG: hypothetical protein GY811_27850 [Myxococcales bacterium]|nr:hypothetical protein [Myxococcales bacterium]
MTLLVLSLVALAAAPIIYRVADRAATTLATLDGFVMVSIAGLAAVHIIPHAVEVSGPLVILVATIGFLGPGWAEHALHKSADRVHGFTMVLAVLGLLLHGFFDGVGLAGPLEHESKLGIAVVLHRLPVAITLWWLLRPRDWRLATVVLVGLAIMTVGGFVTADALAPMLASKWLAFVQALIAGSVLHVVVHRPPPTVMPSSVGKGRFASGVGAIIGLVAVGLVSSEHIGEVAHIESNFGRLFIALSLESAPALLVAFALAGVVQAVLPGMGLSWMKRGSSGSQALRGVAFGLPLPICSCGVIPLYQSLITQTVPATAAMAFLVATPELGVDAVLISLPLLGPEMTVMRVVAAVVIALVVGVIVGRVADRHAGQDEAPHEALGRDESFSQRLVAGLRYGFVEVVDHTGPWIILGIVVAALVGPLFDSPWLLNLPWGGDVIIFTLLGMPAYVCASGATPLVAVLLLQGGSPGAALAFLMAGPATNVTTFGILSQLHGRRLALLFGGTIAMLAIGLGMFVNLIIGELGGLTLPKLHSDDTSMLAIGCLLALGLLYVLSVLRQGPRGFMAQVHSPFQGEGGDHCHDGHDHCH